MHRAFLTVCVAVAIATALAPLASAQASPAPIKLSVDATQAPQKILHFAPGIPGAAGAAHSVLPGMDSRRTHARWSDHQCGRNEIHGGRQDDSVAARSWWRCFRSTSMFRAGVSYARCRFRFPALRASTGFSAGASATAYLDVLSWNQVLLYPARACRPDYTFVAEPETARRLEIRHRTAHREARWRHDRFRPSSADHSGRLAGACGPLFQGDSVDARAKSAARTRHRRG